MSLGQVIGYKLAPQRHLISPGWPELHKSHKSLVLHVDGTRKTDHLNLADYDSEI